jgi:cyclase
MKEYKEKILVETGYSGANVSCIRTNRGLVLVDSPFLPNDARDWARVIVQRTGSEIAYQVNTDHHFDHVLGNSFLTDRVICHQAAARGIKYLEDKERLLAMVRGTFPDLAPDVEADLLKVKIAPPEISFEKSLTLKLDDVTLRLEFVGGHSPGTILVQFLEANTIFTGDNVEEFFPYFGQSRFYVWKDLLKRLLSLDIDIVVPGHGEVGGKDLVEAYFEFFDALENEVKEFAMKGRRVDEMVGDSQVIGFFSLEKMMEEGISRVWVEAQYKIAAKQIISEFPNHTSHL